MPDVNFDLADWRPPSDAIGSSAPDGPSSPSEIEDWLSLLPSSLSGMHSAEVRAQVARGKDKSRTLEIRV